jgi:hypothetical protein
MRNFNHDIEVYKVELKNLSDGKLRLDFLTLESILETKRSQLYHRLPCTKDENFIKNIKFTLSQYNAAWDELIDRRKNDDKLPTY